MNELTERQVSYRKQLREELITLTSRCEKKIKRGSRSSSEYSRRSVEFHTDQLAKVSFTEEDGIEILKEKRDGFFTSCAKFNSESRV